MKKECAFDFPRKLSRQDEDGLDFIIRVDRSVKPIYPHRVERLMHPEFELTGPTEYNLQDGVEQWLHNNQKGGLVVFGWDIYQDLRASNTLITCLNLQDGLAIKQKGNVVFSNLFTDKSLCLWRSVAVFRDVGLCVPYLCGHSDKVFLFWGQLDSRFNSNNLSLRFSK